jgi:hypothetical protein
MELIDGKFMASHQISILFDSMGVTMSVLGFGGFMTVHAIRKPQNFHKDISKPLKNIIIEIGLKNLLETSLMNI